jgi:TetR/AcrR family transcriptional regulator, transcriptional repressor for nem operon
MGRASKAAAEQHHRELVTAAARLFRERDLGAVSVPDLMSAIGLTRGGFYKHFESKDALVAAAVQAAFSEHIDRIRAMSTRHGDDPVLARLDFVDFCLSAAHRDDPGGGCPSALASGISRCDPDTAPRDAFLAGMQAVLHELLDRTSATDDGDDTRDGAGDGVGRSRTLADLATLVGAVLLARATAGDPLSDEILDAARHRLTAVEGAR